MRVLDLQGLLRVAVVSDRASDVDVIRRQLGPLTALSGVDAADADITIRIVDRLSVTGPVRLLGRDAACTDDAFLVLRGARKTRVRVQIPMDRIGLGPIEIVAERGFRAIPLLIPMVNLTLLHGGVVPVHASAFVADGRGTLVTGWAKGGKSEALLAFAARGATYVGDEWVYVSADGSSMAGLPEPMRVWDWQLGMMPAFRRRIGRGRRIRLALAGAVSGTLAAIAAAPGLGSSFVGDIARRTAAIADNQRSIQVPPATMFDGRLASGPSPLHAVVLIESGDGDETATAAIEPSVVANRVAAMIAYEMQDLTAAYQAYRYAFPDRSDPAIESLIPNLERALATAFASTRCIVARHPYPPDIPSLYALIQEGLADD